MSLVEGGGHAPRTAWTLGGLAVLGLAALGPIGLASSESADLAANAFGVGRPLPEGLPLAGVLARLAALAPIGEAGARSQAIAALGGALALALLCLLFGAGAVPRRERGGPSPGTRVAAENKGSISVAVGLLLVGLSRPFLETATLYPGAAVDFALGAGILLLIEIVRCRADCSQAGLGLAFLCGLAAGASWPLRAVSWPVATVMTIWALRCGERWPLVAPTLFVAGGGVSLAGVVPAAVHPPATVAVWLHQLLIPQHGIDASTLRRSFAAALSSLFDDMGVLAVSAMVIGGWSLIWTRSLRTLFHIFLLMAIVATALVNGDVLLAGLVLVTAGALLVARAHDVLARPFGRAQLAVAVVMAVVILLWPASVGIGHTLAAPGRRDPAVIARRLDTRLTVPWSRAIESDREAVRWWRYARILCP